MRKHDPEHLVRFREIEWFRTPTYEEDVDSYGPYKGYYRVNRALHLLNLGNNADRRLVYSNLTVPERINFNPDIQYSGHKYNLIVHSAILNNPVFKAYDGTIITEELMDCDLKEDLAGPDEIVLFTKRVCNGISLI